MIGLGGVGGGGGDLSLHLRLSFASEPRTHMSRNSSRESQAFVKRVSTGNRLLSPSRLRTHMSRNSSFESQASACENIRFSSLFAAEDVSRGGTSATQRHKFHTDDANQCFHNKSGSHTGQLQMQICPILCVFWSIWVKCCAHLPTSSSKTQTLLLGKSIFH